MDKQIINQTSFTAGEISPKLYSQTDTEEFRKGLETATNCYVSPYGPVQRRNGTQYIGAVKTQGKKSRFLSYEVDNNTKFMLEFGDSTLRFYASNAQITESNKTITDITAADPAVVSITSHGYSDGDQVYITAVVGMTEVNNPNTPYIVANKNTDDFELTDLDGANVDSSAFTAYSSAGVSNKIYEITTPYAEADLDGISYFQDGATLYLAHPSYPSRTLIRNGATDWTLQTIDFEVPATTESGRAGNQTLELAATTGLAKSATAGAAFFQKSDIGRQIVGLVDNGIATIVGYTSTTVVTVDISTDFGTTTYTAASEWKVNLSPRAALDLASVELSAVVTVRASELTSAGDTGAAKVVNSTPELPNFRLNVTTHGYSANDYVRIAGMNATIPEFPDGTYRVITGAGSDASNFYIEATHTGVNVNGTTFSAYTASSATVRETLIHTPLATFIAADVGKYIYINGGVLKIISLTSSSVVEALILKSPSTADYTELWSLEDAQWSSANGYPKSVAVHQNRLWFAGSTAFPLRVWGSDVGNTSSFNASTVNDSDGIQVDIVSEKGSISWIHPQRELMIGTIGEELALNGGTASSAITPTNVSSRPRASYGSSVQKPVTVGNSLLFVENGKRRIRSLLYDFSIDSYRSRDLNFLAEHLTEDNIVEIDYTKSPETLLYAITGGGDLLLAAYDLENSVLAWSKYTTNGSIERVLTINKTTNDEVWILVKRTINGATRRYIETISLADGQLDTDGFSDSYQTFSTALTITGITVASTAVVSSSSHGLSNGDEVIIKGLVDANEGDLDSTKTNMSSLNQGSYLVANKNTNDFELTNLSGTAINTSAFNAYSSGGNAYLKVTALSGLDYLEGKTVQVKGDGAVQPTKTVTGGAITATTSAGEFVIGLSYSTTIKTLNHEFSSGLGSMQGQRSRWARPQIKVYRSSKPLLNNEFLAARSLSDPLSEKIPLYSGILEYGALQWSNTTALTITSSDPLPLVVTGITGTIEPGVK